MFEVLYERGKYLVVSDGFVLLLGCTKLRMHHSLPVPAYSLPWNALLGFLGHRSGLEVCSCLQMAL